MDKEMSTSANNPSIVILEMTTGESSFEFANNIETALSSAEAELFEIETRIAET